MNKKLALELEHERGKLTGLGQSNAALREHNSILETALAKREADLVQLNLQVLGLLRGGRGLSQARELSVWSGSCACPGPRSIVLPHRRDAETGEGVRWILKPAWRL